MNQLNEVGIQGLSPSSLIQYIRDPYLFYEQRLLKIKADDEVEAIAEEEDDGGEEKESVVEKDDKKEEDEESFCSFMTRTGSFSSKPSELWARGPSPIGRKDNMISARFANSADASIPRASLSGRLRTLLTVSHL